MNKKHISACIIVKNEIENLPLLIEDLRQFCSEINIVDTGSNDGTVKWLVNNEDDVLKVHFFNWIDDFAAARNFSFSKATKDWVFWCDADDRISQELIDIINGLNLTNSPYNGYYTHYMFGPNYDVPRLRLIKNSCRPVWTGKCHEYVMIENLNSVTIGDEKIATILHQRKHAHSKRNLDIFIAQILNHEEPLTERDLNYYANELRDNGYFEKSAEVSLKYLFSFWSVDAFNAIINNIWNARWIKPEYKYEAIYHLNKLEEKVGYLRSDVYYIRAIIYDYLKEIDRCIGDCHNALTYEMQGQNYGENIEFSKVLPAMTIYNNSKDENEQKRMVEIISRYTEISPYAVEFMKKIESLK